MKNRSEAEITVRRDEERIIHYSLLTFLTWPLLF